MRWEWEEEEGRGYGRDEGYEVVGGWMRGRGGSGTNG